MLSRRRQRQRVQQLRAYILASSTTGDRTIAFTIAEQARALTQCDHTSAKTRYRLASTSEYELESDVSADTRCGLASTSEHDLESYVSAETTCGLASTSEHELESYVDQTPLAAYDVVTTATEYRRAGSRFDHTLAVPTYSLDDQFR